jgi:hypothetical protein
MIFSSNTKLSILRPKQLHFDFLGEGNPQVSFAKVQISLAKYVRKQSKEEVSHPKSYQVQ